MSSARPSLAAAAPNLYSVARTGDLLRVIDPSTGTTLDSVQLSLPGETIAGCNGLAMHPITEQFYALVRTDSGFPPNRKLVAISTSTGAATLIGDTGEKFAGLAFDASGTLYAVTGDGAVTPESLYTLSLTDATPTFVVSLGNGGDGEAVAFNPDDGLLYHASGVDDGINPDTRIFETVDLSLLSATNIPISGGGYSEITALADAGPDLVASDTLGPVLLRVTDAGMFTVLGTMDHVSKGLAFGPNSVPAANVGWRLALLLSLVLAARGIIRTRP